MLFRGNKTASFAGVAAFCFVVLNMVALLNLSLKSQTRFQEKRYENLHSFEENKNQEVLNEIG